MAVSLSAVLLGLINIAIYVLILLLIGVLVQWVLGLCGIGLPPLAVRLYMIIVALIALYLLVALLFGLPMPGPIHLRP